MGATGVWALLMAGGFVVLALLGLAVMTDRARTPRPDLEQLRAEADELAVHAAQVGIDAAGAAERAVLARAEVAVAEQARDLAWAAQEAAEQAYDLAWQAASVGRQAARVTERDETGGADRERAVARAALSAYRRGDISVQELREVFRRSGDWDPAQEERERVAEQRRIEQAAARRAHDRAAAGVRRAEQAARVAEVAAEALVDEAAESAAEADEALFVVERYTARRRRFLRRRG
ncbi:hypothetical protein BDK92_2455 [Micromonospora pisi]|uniref:Uncharacterized protein n=1 Tax=Micromonospora pisi TaxID=589240 RepID=A0A495JHV4_9ACTN|nr:hypothetical protein [Micromonospora pisi]RKR88148.1 hypothetical protein BDK92_2455 [Micromonospora pisi]